VEEGLRPAQQNMFRRRFAAESVRLYQVDARAAVRCGQGAVAGEQRSIERFGESEVGGAVRREIVTHLPDAREQNEMGIASERKIEEIGESFGGAFSGDAG
jgi:hypothetical protein